jgi:hypothetical protein
MFLSLSVIIDRYFITDFGVPSIIRGIDGDWAERGFSRNLRASINRIQSLSIKVPLLPEQQKITAKIEKFEDEIQNLQKLLEQTAGKKERCLKNYLQ